MLCGLGENCVGTPAIVTRQEDKCQSEWQSYDEGEKSWVNFQPKDTVLLETRFQVEVSKAVFLTSELSFNKKHKTPYEFNFYEWGGDSRWAFDS